MLERLGCAVDVAVNGLEALEAVEATAYDLVLMDCQMPVLDGFEAVRRIREAERASGGHLRIVALTANAMAGDRKRCLDAGMDEYLSKPIKLDQLREMLLAQRDQAASRWATDLRPGHARVTQHVRRDRSPGGVPDRLGADPRHPIALCTMHALLRTPCVFVALALCTPALRADEDEPAPIPEPFSHSIESSVTVASGPLEYEASLTDYELRNDEGKVHAHFAAFAYVLKDASPGQRPVTFAFNGGPGSSSVWLHMGILGPRRVSVPSDAENAGAPPYPLVPNPHTILTHTDLVFVDPVGTGFSRAVGEAEDADFWGVREDVDSVAAFIREWLTRNGRWGSPKYVLGESYGGVRGALLATALKQNSTSVALNGLLFVSPAFDIQFVDGREDDLTYVTELPTFAATALYHDALGATVDNREEFLRSARAFASGP